MVTAAAVPVVEKGYSSAAMLPWGALDDEETPDLQWPQSVITYDRMRRQDPQVISVLRAVTYPIRRTPWRIDPAGARPKVVQLVAEDLGLPILGRKPKPAPRTRDRFSWSEHLRLALLHLTFGHSMFEQEYRIVNDLARLRKLAYRPPRTIARFDVATDGGLNAIYQHANGDGADIRIDARTRLVGYVHDREGGNWSGQSLLRPAFGPWWLKQKALRTNAVSVDRNATGVPTYTSAPTPEGLDPAEEEAWREKEKAAGLALATSYRGGENAGASLPNGAKLEFPGVQGKQPDVIRWVQLLDEQIARAVLANFLSLGGENSTGSYALGETFESFFVQSLQTIALDVAEVVTQHVIEDIVDLNFGTNEPAPRLTFDEIGSRHQATAEAIMSLVQCGAITPDAPLDAHLRTHYGLPEADPATARPLGGGTQKRDASAEPPTPPKEGE